MRRNPVKVRSTPSFHGPGPPAPARGAPCRFRPAGHGIAAPQELPKHPFHTGTGTLSAAPGAARNAACLYFCREMGHPYKQ